ncbi:MAG: DNA circularization N-terminal domain-containing protein [Treponema sp.]|jgi:prophage DNA circulation protein|nr:DNA circularization N-terminal domain-containing protein [Treponema sp.]
MSTNAQLANQGFDVKLPSPYNEKWRESYRADASESPRMASYQAPGGEAIPFIQKSFRFSGGHSKDTAEYPFGGLWSNEYLNEKPQSLNVEGYLRGPDYIAQRNKLIEALRVPTDDDNPGYIDLPFWGRFPVVIGDNYEVSESVDEQGQCAVSIPFTRAGVSIAERMDALPAEEAQLESAADNLEAAAIDDFASSLPDDKLDAVTLKAGLGQIKNALLSVIGRVQAAQTALNAMTAEVLGIISLVNQAVLLPRQKAKAVFNAAAAIVGGLMEIKNSAALYGRSGKSGASSGGGSSGSDSGDSGGDTSRAGGSASAAPSLPPSDNERNALIMFLSASDYTLPVDAATVRAEATRKAVENLYRTMAFLAAARIIANSDSLTRQRAAGYWRLLERLEGSINLENPAVYAALRDLRIALSRRLSRQGLSAELIRRFSTATPLLYLAYYLGCDEDAIRRLNSIADSFTVEGGVIYV